MKYLLAILVVGIWCVSALTYLNTAPVEPTAEQSPKLYCFIGAGHGVAVFDYDEIGNGDIITDGNAVFNLKNVCVTWESYKDER